MSVEARIVDALNDGRLDGLEAFMEVPGKRPEQFVTVERTGGPVDLVRQLPVFSVQVWAGSRFQAGELAENVVAPALRSLLSLPWVGRVNINSIHNFPDPDSRESRFQIVVEIVTV